MEEERIIGKGVVFPLEVVNGGIRLDTGVKLIESSLRHIFSFKNNQRYFLGEFNTRLHELLERPLDYVTLSLIDTFVLDTIDLWEKRIQVDSLEKVIDNEIVYVSVNYTIKNTTVKDSFVFPFYTKIIY